MPSYTWTLIEETLTPAVVAASAEDQVARDWKLDPLTGDLVVSPGMQLVRGLQAIAQNCFLRVSMFLGEWFLNLEEGTDWYGSILGKQKDLNVAKAVLRERILGTPGILDLVELEFTVDAGTRTLQASWEATTDLGVLKQTASAAGGI